MSLEKAKNSAARRGREEHRAASCSGGSLSKTKFCSSQGFFLRNKKTGQIVQLDPVRARLSRMKRRVWSWSKALKALSGDYRMVMVTLTYAPKYTWKAGHIRSYMLGVRKILGARLLGYAWVAELQKRGEVHYHVILVMRKNSWIPRSDTNSLWPWGMTKTETAKYPWYIVSYVKKEYQKGLDPELGFPKGLRMFSVFISKNLLDRMTMYEHRLSTFPLWIVDILRTDYNGLMVDVRRLGSGGFYISGQLVTTDWEFLRQLPSSR